MPGNVRKNGDRVHLLDEIRGFAIICMVVYHALFQLKYTYDVNIPIFFTDWFDIIRDIFAGTFIFISGIMCRYSRNNLKRGVQCFFLGMVITFVVPFFGESITFGILHFLGISMMLYGLFGDGLEHLPATVGLIICAVLAVFTWNIQTIYYKDGTFDPGFFGIPGVFEWNLPAKAYEVGALFPFGMYARGYESGDYFPLFPWLFVFLGGSYFGEWSKKGTLPKFFYESHISWLAKAGRYTIWIYMLHLPVIYLICELIFH